jgi:hypothetical protein
MKLLLGVLLSLFTSFAGANNAEYTAKCQKYPSGISGAVDNALRDEFVRPYVTKALITAFSNAGINIDASNVSQPFSFISDEQAEFHFGVSVNGVDRHFKAVVSPTIAGGGSHVDFIYGTDNGKTNSIGQFIQPPTAIVCHGYREYMAWAKLINTDTNKELYDVYLSGAMPPTTDAILGVWGDYNIPL